MVTADRPVRKIVTAAEFDAFVSLPENADRLFELIAGEIVEVPSNPYASKIAMIISGYLFMYLMNNDIGHVTGEAGGYMILGGRYAPDVAFISYAKQPELATKGCNPNPPDLAVEVVSTESGAENQRLTIKLGNYLAAGVAVWIVRLYVREIEVYVPGEQVLVVRRDDENPVIDGGDVLPGFTLNLTDVFKDMDTPVTP